MSTLAALSHLIGRREIAETLRESNILVTSKEPDHLGCKAHFRGKWKSLQGIGSKTMHYPGCKSNSSPNRFFYAETYRDIFFDILTDRLVFFRLCPNRIWRHMFNPEQGNISYTHIVEQQKSFFQSGQKRALGFRLNGLSWLA